jgi:hypothetical protein
MLITTSTTPGQLIPQNRMRKSLVLQNVDGVISVFVKRERAPLSTVTSADFDFRLGPGASIGLNSSLDGTEAIQDRYTVVSASGTPNIAVFETEDVIR